MLASRLLRGYGSVVAATTCLAAASCQIEPGEDETDEEETDTTSDAIFDGTEDSGDAVRQVFYVGAGQCSGTLIAPQVVLFAGHCAPHIATGCDRFAYDQTYAPAPDEGGGFQVIIPPLGSANVSSLDAEHIPVDGVQLHPGYARDDYADACCGGDPANCASCCTNSTLCPGNTFPGFQSNKVHDIAVVHLA
ncbi:MAG: hypothetical protein JNK04_15335, partial [Myxococcales bacterium]|nr:hypothetical protein [Myxococcales bacterium]